MNDKPILYVEKSACCGCGACEAICLRGAIKMSLDNKGFMYPDIDDDKCVQCKLCLKVCPLRKDRNR